MELVIIGANHKTTPLAIREKLALTSRDQKDILEKINNIDYIKEGLVLSTCNRSEIYLVSNDIERTKNFILEIFSSYSAIKKEELQEYIYSYYNLKSVKHLYRVVSGLDSLVLGEVQIISQIKKAFKLANKMKTIDSYLHRLFSEGFRVSKLVRTKTEIDTKAASVSYVAVELARQIFGSLEGETVLILGAGEMSELTLKSLVDHGITGVMVANRTYQRGKQLAEKFDGEAVTWDKLAQWVPEVDIIIASTAAPHYVLHHKAIQQAMKNRKRPLFLIDIAVPRDVEPEIANIAGVHLYDIDDLEAVVEENLDQRREELAKVESIINDELEEFESWLNYRQAVPLIKDIRARAEEIKSSELTRALKRLSQSKSNEEDIIYELANRLVNKLLHKPTIEIKELANSNNANQKIQIAKDIFK